MSGNAVAEVEGGALAGLGVLRELDLSGNRLAVLPEDVGVLLCELCTTRRGFGGGVQAAAYGQTSHIRAGSG